MHCDLLKNKLNSRIFLKISDVQTVRTASGISVFPGLVRHQEKHVNSFKPPEYGTVDFVASGRVILSEILKNQTQNGKRSLLVFNISSIHCLLQGWNMS